MTLQREVISPPRIRHGFLTILFSAILLASCVDRCDFNPSSRLDAISRFRSGMV